MPDKKIDNIERQESASESKENSNLSEALGKVDSSMDIADLMEGVDMGDVSEKASEKRENKGDSNKKQSTKTQQDDSKPVKTVHRPLPSINLMRRKIEQKMREEQTVLISELSAVKDNPYAYAEKVKEIRKLRQKIADFLGKAADFIKDMYLKFFGSRHGVENSEQSTENK